METVDTGPKIPAHAVKDKRVRRTLVAWEIRGAGTKVMAITIHISIPRLDHRFYVSVLQGQSERCDMEYMGSINHYMPLI